MFKTSKIYQNYKIKGDFSVNVKETFEKQGPTADRKYMNKQMKDHIDFFESHRIEQFQNFIKLLYKYGCKAEDQQKFFAEFIKYMKINKNINIFLLKSREMKKANAGERNILMNRIAYEYPNEFLTFLRNFLYQNYPLKLFTKSIIKKFHEMVKQLIRSQKLNDSNLFDLLNLDEFSEIIQDQDEQTGVFDDDQQELFFIY